MEENEDKEEKELDFGEDNDEDEDDDDDDDDVERELNDDDVAPLDYASSGTLKKSEEVYFQNEAGK